MSTGLVVDDDEVGQVACRFIIASLSSFDVSCATIQLFTCVSFDFV